MLLPVTGRWVVVAKVVGGQKRQQLGPRGTVLAVQLCVARVTHLFVAVVPACLYNCQWHSALSSEDATSESVSGVVVGLGGRYFGGCVPHHMGTACT